VEDVRILLGRRIRDLRTQRKLSQEELAHRAGIHTTYLSSVENGKRNLAIVNIANIAAALRISLSDLFSSFPEKLAAQRRKRRSR
jgi:XRE family transcriptional regulator, regulator of sulfur utilization